MSSGPDPERRAGAAGILVLGLAIAALLPAAYRMARPFLTAFVLAAILSVALDPLQQRANRLVKRSSLAAFFTTLVGLGPILAIILLAGVMIVREIKSADLSGIWHAREWLESSAGVDRQAVIQKTVAELSQAGGALFTTCLAVIFLYVLLLRGRGWVAQVPEMVPLDKAVTARILSTTRDAIVANVDGIVAVSAAEGIVFGIVFAVARIPSPILWAVIAGLSTLVPIVGGTIVWLPIAVTLAIHKAYAKAIIVAVGSLAGQVAVSELLRPAVISSRLQQPPLLIALSVLGGTDAFGPLGVLLGPVIVSVLAALAREFRLQLRPQTD